MDSAEKERALMQIVGYLLLWPDRRSALRVWREDRADMFKHNARTWTLWEAVRDDLDAQSAIDRLVAKGEPEDRAHELVHGAVDRHRHRGWQEVHDAERKLFEAESISSAKRLTTRPIRTRDDIRELAKALHMLSVDVSDRDIQDVGAGMMELAAQIENPEEAPQGMTLPWDELNDNLPGGLLPGELLAIVARSSEHKTTTARQIADHNAREGRSVVFWTMEDGHGAIAGRTAAAHVAGVTTDAIRDPSRIVDTVNVAKRVKAEGARMMALKFRTIARASPRLGDVLAEMHLLAADGVDLLVLDFWQLIQPDNPRESAYDVQWAKRAFAQIKGAAGQLGIAVILTAQITANATRDDGLPKDTDAVLGATMRQECWATLVVGKDRDSWKIEITKSKAGQPCQWELDRDAPRDTLSIARHVGTRERAEADRFRMPTN